MLIRMKFDTEGEILSVEIERFTDRIEETEWGGDELVDRIVRNAEKVPIRKEFEKVIRIDGDDCFEDISSQFDHGTLFDA